jgi:integrase
MDQTEHAHDSAFDDVDWWRRMKYSHPRYSKVETDADIANLPRYSKEYHVRVKSFDDGEATFAELFLRVRSDSSKSFAIRFRGGRGAHCRTMHLGNAGKLTLAEYIIKARRIVEQALEGDLPKYRPKLPRGIALADAFIHYQKAHPVSADWDKARTVLIERYVISRYGRAPASFLSHERLTALCDNLSLLEPGQARTLLKVLKPFLRWCVKSSLISGHPLYGFKLIVPRRNTTRLSITDLAKIYAAANHLGGYWQSIVGLCLATTEAVEDIRVMQAKDVNRHYGEWWPSHKTDRGPWGGPDAHVIPLSSFALALLEPYRGQSNFVFASPRRHRNGEPFSAPLELPIQWRSGITQKLRKLSGVPGDWTLREIRRSAIILSRRHKVAAMYAEAEPMERQKALRDALQAWGQKLSSAIEDHLRPLTEDDLEDEVMI